MNHLSSIVQQLAGKKKAVAANPAIELSDAEIFLRGDEMIGINRPEIIAYYMDEEQRHFVSIVWQPDDMPTDGHDGVYLAYSGINKIPFDRDAYMMSPSFRQVLDIAFDDFHLRETDFRRATVGDYSAI